jgi:Mrp family chromosome partitioning ATPase
VQRAAEGLAQVGAKILGVLVNDVDVDRAGYGYYGYHGAAGGYLRRYHTTHSDGSKRTA